MSVLLNRLYFPAWLSLITASICFFLAIMFQVIATDTEQKYSNLEAKIRSIQCSAVDQALVLEIAKGDVEETRMVMGMVYAITVVFLGVGISSFMLTYQHLNQAQKK